jgi:hypothetical protein
MWRKVRMVVGKKGRRRIRERKKRMRKFERKSSRKEVEGKELIGRKGR